MTVTWWREAAVQSIKSALVYRSSSILVVVFGLLFSVAQVVATLVYYRYTNAIGGWGFYEFLTLVGSSVVVSSGYQLLFVLNHEDIVDRIVDGSLDYDLLRPVDSQVLLSTKRLDVPSAVTLLVGLGVYAYGAQRVPALSVWSVAAWLSLCAVSVWFLYCVNHAFVSLAFWIERAHSLTGVSEYLLDLGQGPARVYPRLVQHILTSILPVVAATNLPVDVTWHALTVRQLVWFLSGVATATGMARYLWQRGLRRYYSAN